MKSYALIGHKIEHSISDFIHKELFKLSDYDGEYKIMDLDSIKTKEDIKSLYNLNGFNVTIPYKTEIIKYINNLSENSLISKSVNTVKVENNELYGYTTDLDAFNLVCKEKNIDLSKDIMILGCGGVSKSIALSCILNKAKSITFAVRKESFEKTQNVISDFHQKTGYKIDICDINKIEKENFILINATPVGMYKYKESIILSRDIIKKSSFVFDTIYNPIETPLLKIAKEENIKTSNGIEMLIYQAALSHKIWYNTSFDKKDLHNIIENSISEIRKNYV